MKIPNQTMHMDLKKLKQSFFEPVIESLSPNTEE